MKDWYKYRYLVLTARSADYTRFGAVYAAATDAEAAEEEAAALNVEMELKKGQRNEPLSFHGPHASPGRGEAPSGR
jgi:hypothetical protein